LIKESPNVPELNAQMEEVQKLITDLRTGLVEHPEADKLEEVSDNDDDKMQEE
jgi:hypothetical protein